MEEITTMWPPVSYISSLWCILLGSCCFNLWEFPHGCFHMVAWLTMRADRIIGLVAANKLLLLSDPMRVFHDAFPWLLVCLCVYLPTCVSQCVCMCAHDPGLLVSEKEMCFLPPPRWAISFYYFTCTSSCAQLTRKISLIDRSPEWLLLLSRPQKRQQLSAIETFTFIFLKKKWMWMRQEKKGGKKGSIEGSRPALLKRKKDLDVSCLKWM